MPYTPNTPWIDGSGGGTPITAARLNNLEAGLTYELGYTEYTANVAISATTEATANTVVTAPAITFNGTTVALVKFYAPGVETGATAASHIVICLYLDGTSIGFFGQVTTPAAAVTVAPVNLERRVTPAAGSRTYSVRAYRITSNGQVYGGTGGAANYMPGFIRIERAL